MSQNKKKKSKKSSRSVDPLKIAMFSLIGLLVVLIATVAVFRAMENSYHIRSWSELTTKQDEGIYFVYFYDDDCPACHVIANEVSNFRKSNALDLPMYYIDASNVQGTRPSGVTATPTVIVIEDGILADIYVGIEEIRGIFKVVNEGNFITD